MDDFLRELHIWLYTTLDSVPRDVWEDLLRSSTRGVKAICGSPVTRGDPMDVLIAIAAVIPQSYFSIFNLVTEALATICQNTPPTAEHRERVAQIAELLKKEDRGARAKRITRALDDPHAPAPVRQKKAPTTSARQKKAPPTASARQKKAPPTASARQKGASPAPPFRTRFGETLPKLPNNFTSEGVEPREHMFYFVLCRLSMVPRSPWEVPRDDPRMRNVVWAYIDCLGEDPLEDTDKTRRAFYTPFRRNAATHRFVRRFVRESPPLRNSAGF